MAIDIASYCVKINIKGTSNDTRVDGYKLQCKHLQARFAWLGMKG